jgi:threonine/homoserine/homoserine lactone efflux protein
LDQGILVRGLIMGFSIAAPVGPIGLLCIRRTLNEGRTSGLLTGLGAASADAIYGSLAAFGLTLITSILISQRIWLSIAGGLFLCYLGIKTLLSKPAEQTPALSRHGLLSSYASTFLLTLTNPMTVLFFLGIFAGLGATAGSSASYASAATLVLGVFLGSCLWWLVLSESVSLLRGGFSASRLQWVNRISGLVIALFGLVALLTVMPT